MLTERTKYELNNRSAQMVSTQRLKRGLLVLHCKRSLVWGGITGNLYCSGNRSASGIPYSLRHVNVTLLAHEARDGGTGRNRE